MTADVVGLYLGIPHKVGLRAQRKALDKRNEKTILTEEFGNKMKQQISGTAIATKFAPPYAYIFMKDLETKFLEGQFLQPLAWLQYIDEILFSSGQIVKRVFKKFQKNLAILTNTQNLPMSTCETY